MTTTYVEVFLAMPMPSNEPFETSQNKDKSRTSLYAAIDDLTSSSEKLDFRIGSGILKPKIHQLDGRERKEILARRLFPRKDLARCEILCIQSAIPLGLYDDIDWPEGEESKSGISRLLAHH